MYSSYPGFRKIITLLFVLLVAGSTQAQHGELAKHSTNTIPVIASDDARIDALLKIASRTDRQVILTWSPVGVGVSHYVLERSSDGRHYEEAGVFFTGDGIDEPDYVYKDKLTRSYTGILFYRLRVVGFNGTVAYTHPGVSQTSSNNTNIKK